MKKEKANYAFSFPLLYVTGLELTTLTNLLFIVIPQGYLPCVKLFTSSIWMSSF